MLTTCADKCYYDHYLRNKVFIKNTNNLHCIFHCVNVELVIILGHAYLFDLEEIVGLRTILIQLYKSDEQF